MRANNLVFKCTSLIMTVMVIVSCAGNDVAGVRTDALDDALWNASEWISASDADVVTGRISGRNWRAADGASWFVSEVENDKKVVSAVWMTTALGPMVAQQSTATMK